MSAEEYIKELKLDEDMVEDVQQEIDDATAAWKDVVGEDKDDCLIEKHDDLIFSSLLGKFGSIYSEEDHGSGLKCLVDAESSCLSKSKFIDWYLKWIFHSDGDEDQYDEADLEKEVSVLPSSSATPSSNLGWSGISWSVKPNEEVKAGISWKCSNCYIVNKWDMQHCLGCDSEAPHSASLKLSQSTDHPAVVPAGFTFGSSTTNTINPSSFKFGGDVPPINGTSSNEVSGTIFGFGSSSSNNVTSFVFGNTTVSVPKDA